jgi:hypothetical protein
VKIDMTIGVGSRKRIAALLAALFVAGALAGFGAAALKATLPARLGSGALGKFFFGPQMVRSEVVMKIGPDLHDYRIDQGRVRAVTASSLKLKERDGTVVVIPVASGAMIRVNGRVATLAQVRVGYLALTIRDGATAAATAVRANAVR